MQIARQIEGAIFTGVYREGDRIPSTNEMSVLLSINPQTVLKGMTILVGEDIIYKKRGLGMYVCEGALSRIHAKRLTGFCEKYIIPATTEAKSLGIDRQELIAMIEREYSDEHTR